MPTLGRRISAARTVQSVLADPRPDLEVLLVDQCLDPVHPEAFPDDPRFRYVASNTVGISAGRNAGVELARGDVIAHTDDDCSVSPGWASTILSVFEENPGIDLAYGGVEAAAAPAAGFIPAYRVSREVVVSSLRSTHRIDGMGACFAYRRPVWEAVGGFDEALGAGAELESAEEVDFTQRALTLGHVVMETPRFSVVHHGYRSWEALGALLRGHLVGIGAVSAKQLRLRKWSYWWTLTLLAWRWAFGEPAIDFGRRPPRMVRLRAFARGLSIGWGKSINAGGVFDQSAPPGGRRPPVRVGESPVLVTRHEAFPSFFVIGAAKAGTTSLHEHLRVHPQVFMSPLKEPNFMALSDELQRDDAPKVLRESIQKMPDTPAKYVDLFRGARSMDAIGESSPWYLNSTQAAERIRYYVPTAKLIVLLRDPAERAFSAYKMHRRLGTETCDTFEAALERHEERAGTSNWGLDYLTPGFYRRHLAAYEPELRAGSLRVWMFEELRDDAKQLVRSVYSFLGVDPDFVPPRLGVRFNDAGKNALSLSPETRERLISVYRDDVLALEDLIKRDLSHWLRAE